MNEAQIIERIALLADDQAAEGAQPGEAPLDLPTAALASQGTAVLGRRTCAASSMGSNHCDAELGQRRVQGIGVRGAIPNQSAGDRVEEAGSEGWENGGDQGNLVRRS